MSRGPAAGEPFRQILTRNVFLGNVVHPFTLSHFVDLHDVRMNQRRRSPRLAEKTLDISRIGSQIRFKYLEGDVTAQRQLLRQIDFGHRATTQTSQQPVVTQRTPGEIRSTSLGRWTRSRIR